MPEGPGLLTENSTGAPEVEVVEAPDVPDRSLIRDAMKRVLRTAVGLVIVSGALLIAHHLSNGDIINKIPVPADYPVSPITEQVPIRDSAQPNSMAGVIKRVEKTLNFPQDASAQEPEGDEVSPQVIGGVPVLPGEYEYVVGLGHIHNIDNPLESYYCVVTLISNREGITGGRCTSRDIDQNNMILIIGHDLREPDELVPVQSVFRPSCYDEENAACDFAIVTTVTPVTGVDNFAFISPFTPSAGTPVTVVGAGRTSAGGSFSPVFMKVDLPMQSQYTCQRSHPEWYTDDMVCAGGGGASFAFGDGGAPALFGDFVVGVGSWMRDYSYFGAMQRNHLSWALVETGVGVPANRIAGGINDETGEFTFTAHSPYPGMQPDSIIGWRLTGEGFSLVGPAALTWNDIITGSLEGEHLYTVVLSETKGRRIISNVVIHAENHIQIPSVFGPTWQ